MFLSVKVNSGGCWFSLRVFTHTQRAARPPFWFQHRQTLVLTQFLHTHSFNRRSYPRSGQTHRTTTMQLDVQVRVRVVLVILQRRFLPRLVLLPAPRALSPPRRREARAPHARRARTRGPLTSSRTWIASSKSPLVVPRSCPGLPGRVLLSNSSSTNNSARERRRAGTRGAGRRGRDGLTRGGAGRGARRRRAAYARLRRARD